MPRVPTAGTTTTPIAVPALGQPERTVGLAQAVAGVFDQGAAMAFEFGARQTTARRQLAVAEGVSGLTTDIGALQQEAANDPEINGSAERFSAAAKAALDARLEGIDDPVVANEIRSRGLRMAAAAGVSVSQTERNRFVDAAKTTMEGLTDNYVTARIQAPNDVAKGEVDQNFNDAINNADVLTLREKDVLRSRFQKRSASAEAISALRVDPQAFLEELEGGGFGGLDDIQQARFATAALDEIDRLSTTEERLASAEIKTRQADTFKAAFNSVLDPETEYTTQELREDLPNLSNPDARLLRTIIASTRVVVDDTRAVIDMTQLVSDGDPDAFDRLKQLTIDEKLSLDTFRSYATLIETTQGPDASPMQGVIRTIKQGLGPDIDDNDRQAADKAIRLSRAMEFLNQLVDDGREVTPALGIEVLTRFRPLESDVSEQIAVIARPFGFDGSRESLTLQDIAKSKADIAEAIITGRMSANQHRFEIKNVIEPLERLVRQRDEIRAAREAESRKGKR